MFLQCMQLIAHCSTICLEVLVIAQQASVLQCQHYIETLHYIQHIDKVEESA